MYIIVRVTENWTRLPRGAVEFPSWRYLKLESAWPKQRAGIDPTLIKQLGLHDHQTFIPTSTFLWFCDMDKTWKDFFAPICPSNKPLQQLGRECMEDMASSSAPRRSPKGGEFQLLAAVLRKSFFSSFLFSSGEWGNNLHPHCRNITSSRSSPDPKWGVGPGLP